MTENSLLLICPDPEIAGALVRLIDPTTRATLSLAISVEGAINHPEFLSFGVIVLFSEGGGARDESDLLMRSLSVAGSAVPVIVLSPQYDVAQALVCFRMGVTDYLGMREHHDVLACVVAETLSARVVAGAELFGNRVLGRPEISRPRSLVKGT